MSGYIGSKQSVALSDSYNREQQDALLANFAGIPIGVPFGVWDHLTGVAAPSNTGVSKFIKLTAGEDGAGQFNENLVSNEVITGAGDLVVVTADIAVGVLLGQTVSLLNSESRYLKSGASSGTVANDQMQTHAHTMYTANTASAQTGLNNSSALSPMGSTNNTSGAYRPRIGATGVGILGAPIELNSSTAARNGTRTDTKHSQITQYMRIA
jgi:hypothetical protein